MTNLLYYKTYIFPRKVNQNDDVSTKNAFKYEKIFVCECKDSELIFQTLRVMKLT